MPPPPVRLTTLTGCFSSASNPLAKMRITESMPPPAAQGTINCTGRSGKATAGAAPIASVAKAKASLRKPFILFLPCLSLLLACKE
jgi:hypothetical protein